MQTLPVVKYGSEAEIINSTVQKSVLWQGVTELHLKKNMRVNPQEKEFCEYLLQVGKGAHDICDEVCPHIMKVPQKFLVKDLDSLIKAVFPNMKLGYKDKYFLANFLTPLNVSVDSIKGCDHNFSMFFSTFISKVGGGGYGLIRIEKHKITILKKPNPAQIEKKK